MTNKEHFKDEIFEIACNREAVAIDKTTNKLRACAQMSCSNCLLDGYNGTCRDALAEWLNSEYVEPCPFEKDELVEVSGDGVNWSLRYFSNIIRDKKGEKEFLTFVNGQDSKGTGATWTWRYCRKYGTLGGLTK